ncbi:MAG: nicotinate-nucleotide adenylyltransferase [Fimbriimonadaceae bacterium]|nr:nicotinate-nucleotide adenylyltransferase [Fimbriimonadaceae bacterium]
MSEEKPRIGILGGTFDPPHNGHLHIAELAKKHLELSEVILVPAARNPLKRRAVQATPKQRLEMCELAIEGEEGISVSDIELTRGAPSYAIETLEEFQQVHPGQYWFILGADSIRTLPEWHQIERFEKYARFAVFHRDGTHLEDAAASLSPEIRGLIDEVAGPTINISSSKIRESVQAGAGYRHWVPGSVADYIERSNLYR